MSAARRSRKPPMVRAVAARIDETVAIIAHRLVAKHVFQSLIRKETCDRVKSLLSQMEASMDTQSRKYLVTINNPFEHGYTRENLRQRITAMKPLVYFCAAEEVGLETGTHHIHIYLAFSSGVRFSTMRRAFSQGGDIETARGTSAQIRDYVAKAGKWADDEKADTSIEGTFEEWGTLPNEHQGTSGQELAVIERIQEGASNAALLFEFPSICVVCETLSSSGRPCARRSTARSGATS